MIESNSSGKRLLKNTLMLYVRMLFMVGVSLYTSRVVLATLGVEDFGIYNVVGGLVVVLSFLRGSMAGASQRFLNIELGKNDYVQLKNVFSTSLTIHLIIALVVLIVAESIGLYFLNYCMNISPDRQSAANWVFQFSIISFFISIACTPYNAVIISHERMSAFAYISIIEALLKLAIVFLLQMFTFDKLKIYAVLMAAVSAIVCFAYMHYAMKNFDECKDFKIKYDKVVLKNMLSFSSWTIFGALGSLSHTQGIALVINLFFGATVNAAQGIANQVVNVVNNFVANFMMALSPQIVKTYAANELSTMHDLVKRGGRLGICLVAVFAIPLFLEIPTILQLWLTEVPEYTVVFIRIILLTSLCNAYAQPLATAQSATGNIKRYQIILTTLGWLHLPLACVFFYFGCKPYYAMYVYFVLVNVMQMVRIVMVCKNVDMSIGSFCKNVIIRSGVMVVVSFCVPFVCHRFLSHSYLNSFIVMTLAFVLVVLNSYFIVATDEERKKIKRMIISKIKKVQV